jgi:hypothetical protein
MPASATFAGHVYAIADDGTFTLDGVNPAPPPPPGRPTIIPPANPIPSPSNWQVDWYFSTGQLQKQITTNWNGSILVRRDTSIFTDGFDNTNYPAGQVINQTQEYFDATSGKETYKQDWNWYGDGVRFTITTWNADGTMQVDCATTTDGTQYTNPFGLRTQLAIYDAQGREVSEDNYAVSDNYPGSVYGHVHLDFAYYPNGVISAITAKIYAVDGSVWPGSQQIVKTITVPHPNTGVAYNGPNYNKRFTWPFQGVGVNVMWANNPLLLDLGFRTDGTVGLSNDLLTIQ